MKIKTSDTPDATRMDLNPTRATREADGPAGSTSVSTNRTPSSDSIAISGTNSLVQQALGSGSADRAARVLELQQQVQSGQYQVDAVAVSRALIAAHLAGE
ncbi:MAG TPA: flagellar biosynthesis anti-sigma factor FlgM [Bryobacteraceae bacterium]|jgi:flagellar biosynthesis anti-sigma factor FlgM|nr:flagellar biosynthesis anti-sigma factor FlgM [Bryobacteraceae bacterium]